MTQEAPNWHKKGITMKINGLIYGKCGVMSVGKSNTKIWWVKQVKRVQLPSTMKKIKRLTFPALVLRQSEQKCGCYYRYQRFWHINDATGSFPLYWLVRMQLWTRDAFACRLNYNNSYCGSCIAYTGGEGATSLEGNWWCVNINKLVKQHARSGHWSVGIEAANLKTLLCSQGWGLLCFLGVLCCG